MTEQVVGTVHAANAAVIQRLVGDVVFQLAEKPASDFILEFDFGADTFVGRDSAFAALDAFASQHASGYFEVVGDAGLGKTALAAEIARRKGAIAFFASGGYGTAHAGQFLAHVSAELLVRYALGRTSLPAHVGDNAAVLSQLLREAVRKAAGGQVWVVVDGLDEADAPPIGANPLLLPLDLPAGVFVVVTRRTGSMVAGPATALRRYELRRDDPCQQADIEALVRHRVAHDERIRRALANTRPAMTPGERVAALTGASEGNFMYLSFVLADIVEAEPTTPLDLTRLPYRLTGYYDHFWARISAARTEDWAAWDGLYRPVLERLAVAYDAVSAEWLAAQIGRSPDEIRARVLEPWSRVLSRMDRSKVKTWRLVHRTFSDYLGEEGRVDLGAAHAAVAESYVRVRWARFDDWDAYGLQHAAAHVAAAARGAQTAEQHDLAVMLARLVVDERFIQRQLGTGDPALLERNLGLAQQLVSSDESAEATFHLVPLALTLLRFRRELLQPTAIFEAARRGEVTAARQLLHLTAAGLEHDWQMALSLMIAWLAAERAPEQAMALRDEIHDRMVEGGSTSRVLCQLHDRLGNVVQGDEIEREPLPDPPDRGLAHAILDRLGGSVRGAAQRSSLYCDRDLFGDGGVYLSRADAPMLVALVVHDPVIGEPVFQRYVELHGSYGYPQYRSGSLWSVLAAMLSHPDQGWARDQLPRLGTALMAPASGEFLEGLELALLARLAVCGDDRAAGELARRAEKALVTAATMPSAGGTAAASAFAGSQEVGDVWAIHRRRLSALAEAVALAPGTRARAGALMTAAIGITGGFAGFAAPAHLTLAESASMLAPAEAASSVVRRALTNALHAAHNIRDPVFAMRVTARVNAMCARWWPAPTGMAEAATSLAQDAGAARFAALHAVGESMTYRETDDLPTKWSEAASLRELAHAYGRPLSEFVRLNGGSGWGPDDRQPEGTPVNVPDPGLAPQIASRIAAGLLGGLGDEQPPGEVRRDHDHALIRRLVPVASRSPTALATTLGRLILATRSDDLTLLDELRQLVSTPLDPAGTH